MNADKRRCNSVSQEQTERTEMKSPFSPLPLVQKLGRACFRTWKASPQRVQLLETSFVIDRLELLAKERFDNAIQVGLRVGEKRDVFVMVCVNDEGFRFGNEPKINRVA